MDERTDLVKRKNSQDPEFFVDEAENGHPPPSTVGVQSPGRTRATVAGGRGTAGRLRVGCCRIGSRSVGSRGVGCRGVGERGVGERGVGCLRFVLR